MIENIDVRGLSEEDTMVILQLVKSLKKKSKAPLAGDDAFLAACGGWKDIVEETPLLADIYADRLKGRTEATL